MKKKKVIINVKNHRDKNGGHPHVILEDIDDKHVSVGFTTRKSKGKGHSNYELEISPLKDGKHSYMRKQGTVAKVGEYYQPRKGVMTEKDYAKAKVYGSRAKQKYLNKKK